jgi:hypothetical protein
MVDRWKKILSADELATVTSRVSFAPIYKTDDKISRLVALCSTRTSGHDRRDQGAGREGITLGNCEHSVYRGRAYIDHSPDLSGKQAISGMLMICGMKVSELTVSQYIGNSCMYRPHSTDVRFGTCPYGMP